MEKKLQRRFFDYYALLFFLLAFIGWLWEVLLYLVTDHALINRGVYRGPYLPIYGAGGLLICFALQRLKERPILVFFSSMLLSSALEYFTSYFLEKRWGLRWWDYSGHTFHIGGRVCLAGAVLFGLGGALLVCWFLPFYERWYQRIPWNWRTGLTLALLVIFVLDATYCALRPNVGEGISQDAQFVLRQTSPVRPAGGTWRREARELSALAVDFLPIGWYNEKNREERSTDDKGSGVKNLFRI